MNLKKKKNILILNELLPKFWSFATLNVMYFIQAKPKQTKKQKPDVRLDIVQIQYSNIIKYTIFLNMIFFIHACKTLF